MFKSKIDKFTKYDNGISDLKSEKTECLKKIQELNLQISNINNEISNINNAKRDFGINYYLDRKRRVELLEMAEKYGFSPEKLNELRRYIDEWNQDCVTNDVVDSFRIIEKFVCDNQESYKKNMMYKLSKFFNDSGRNLNEN